MKNDQSEDEEVVKDGPVRHIGPASKEHQSGSGKEFTAFQRHYKGKDGKERVKWMKVDIIKDKDGNTKADYDNARTATEGEYKDIFREIYWKNLDKAGVHAMDSKLADTLVSLSDKAADAGAIAHAEDTGKSGLLALGKEGMKQGGRVLLAMFVGGAIKAGGKATLKQLGLGKTKLKGASYNKGRKQLEKAGFEHQGTTSTGRQVFVNKNTGASVSYDPSKKASNNHWHITDAGGQKYSSSGRAVEASSGAAHIPGKK